MNHPSYLYYDVFDSPVGPITVLADNKGVNRIDYGQFEQRITFYQAWTKKHFLKGEFKRDADQQFVKQTKMEINEYFSGDRKQFTIPLNCYGTSFQRSVWRALLHSIPHGEVKSYKEVAEVLQAPKSVRAVGGAVNKNPFSIVVPCHRVIGSNGKLVGYAGGLDKKQQLLDWEGNPQLQQAK